MTSSSGHVSECSDRPSTLKVRLGRPKKSSLPENVQYTEDEKRDKRRIANRDSARRMRARRLENLDWLSKQVQELQQKCQQLQNENSTLVTGCQQLREENEKLTSMVTKLQGAPLSQLGTFQALPSLPEATSSIACNSGESSETEGQLRPRLRLTGLASSASPQLPSATVITPTSGMQPAAAVHLNANRSISSAGTAAAEPASLLPGAGVGCNTFVPTPASSPALRSPDLRASPTVHQPASGFDATCSETWCRNALGAMAVGRGDAPAGSKQAVLPALPLLDSSTSSLMDDYTSLSSHTNNSASASHALSLSASHSTTTTSMHPTSLSMMPPLNSGNMFSGFPQSSPPLGGLCSNGPCAPLQSSMWPSNQRTSQFSSPAFPSLSQDALDSSAKQYTGTFSAPLNNGNSSPALCDPSPFPLSLTPPSMDSRGGPAEDPSWLPRGSTLPPLPPLSLPYGLNTSRAQGGQGHRNPHPNAAPQNEEGVGPEAAKPLLTRHSCGTAFSSGFLDDALASLFPNGLTHEMSLDLGGRANSLSWLKAV